MEAARTTNGPWSDTDHEVIPVQDSTYRVGRGNATGTKADLRNAQHYPVEAICTACGFMVRSESFSAPWTHTGRRPGDPR